MKATQQLITTPAKNRCRKP